MATSLLTALSMEGSLPTRWDMAPFEVTAFWCSPRAGPEQKEVQYTLGETG